MRNLTLTLAILGVYSGVAFGARWTESSAGLPGAGAPIRTLVIDPATASTLYAETFDGSLFKSTDSTASWRALSNIAGVNALALDPTSASTLYAGTSHGLLKSTNEGVSWVSTGLSETPVAALAVDPVTPSTLYAAGFAADYGPHIYKSADGGASWRALSLSPAFIGSITLDPVTPSTLYVTGTAILKSTDGGESWNVINTGFVSLLVIDPTTPSTLYAVRYNILVKSTDGGASWTDTGFERLVIGLTIDPKNSNILYAATNGYATTNGGGQAIFKSTNGGRSWNTANTSIPAARSLVLNPLDSSTIYTTSGSYGTSGGVFKSTDGGMNWSQADIGLRAMDIRVLVGDPVDPATVYAGGDAGLFRSVDSGGSWSQRAAFQVTCCTLPPGFPAPPPFFPPVAPAGLRSLVIDYTNPNILYARTARINGCAFTDILLFKSTDGGATWSDSITPDKSGCVLDGNLMVMAPTDPNTLYLGEGNEDEGYALLKSTDGGANWNRTGLGEAVNVLVIDPTSPATLYAGTGNGVFQSTDGGATWNMTGLAKTNVNLLANDPLQPNILYAGATGAFPASLGVRGLFKSTDRGASWSPINHGLEDVLSTRAPVSALVMDPDHSGVLYVGTSGYGVFKSSDGGATWALFNDGLTPLDARVLAIARGASPTLYVGTAGGVFKIVDDGN